MDDISRGSASDAPGQGRVRRPKSRRRRVEIADRISDPIATVDSDPDAGLAESGGIPESAAPIDGLELSDREELLMAPENRTEPPTPEDSGVDEDLDEIPVEDRPQVSAAEEIPVEVDSEIGVADHDPEGEDQPSPPEGELANVVCAMLLSSREPLSFLRLAQATHTSPKQIATALDELRSTLAASKLPLEVNVAGEQVRLLTAPEVFGFLRNLRTVKKQEKLSAAALETLAVVAYRQPVMRAEIEAIRGVKAGPIMRTLLDHRMVKVTGRADVPGRPLEYGTTQHFLETFGLSSLKDLPSVKEFRSL